MTKRIMDWLNWIANRELAILAIISPLLLLSEWLRPLAVLAIAAVLLLWLNHRVVRGRLALGAHIDVPVAALIVMLLIGVWVSADSSLSFPKFCMIVLGVAVFYALVHNLRTRAQIEIALWLLTLMGAAVAILGLLSTDWFESKVFTSAIYGALPRLALDLPRSTRGGFHPNEVGGTLAMFVPIYVALLLASRRRASRGGSTAGGDPPGPGQALLSAVHRFATPLLLAGLALTLVIIVLTQSRGALLALAFVLMAMVATRTRIVLVVLPITLLLGIMWMQPLGQASEPSLPALELQLPGETLLEAVSAVDRGTAPAKQGETTSWSARIEIWTSAIQACRDYPYTGVGLANFPTVSRANYIYEQVPLQFNMAHAHSLYLQTAVDLGIVGLLAFLWLVLSMIWPLWHLLGRTDDQTTRWLGTGLLGGVLSYLAFGFFDAVPLGAKPSIAFWMMAGLAVALARQLGQAGMPLPTPRRIRPGRQQILALALLVLIGLALVGTPALHSLFRNAGAVALDKAQLQAGLSSEARRQWLSTAERALSTAIAYDHSVSAHRRLGIVYTAQGDDERALLEWQQDGAASRFLQQQGRWSISRGDLIAAAQYYELAIRQDPGSGDSYYALAMLHGSQGRQDDALAVYDAALNTDAVTADPIVMSQMHVRRAQIHRQQGRWPEALDDYRAAVRLSKDVAWYRVGLARALYTVEQDAAAAEVQLRTAMELAPTYHWPYVVLSEIFLEEGRYAEALAAADTAAQLAPQEVWPLVFRGRGHLAEEAYEPAIRDLEQALSLDPGHATAHYWLGQAYWAVGRREEAIHEYERAIELAPGTAYMERALSSARQEMMSTAPEENDEDQ